MLRRIYEGQIARAFVAFIGVGLIAFAFTPNEDLIQFLNIMVMSCSAGVAVAYFHLARDAFLSPKPTDADVLGFGIFAVHLGNCFLRIISLLRRSLDLKWISDTDLVSFTLCLILVGGIAHLNAHRVEGGVVPLKQWRKVGTWFAIALFATAVLVWYKTSALRMAPH